MSEFIFLPGADESANERLARFHEEFLAKGPVGWIERAEDFRAIIKATWLNGAGLWKLGGTTCAFWQGTGLQAAQVQARRKSPPATGINTWIGAKWFKDPDGDHDGGLSEAELLKAEWIPAKYLKAGLPILRGDIFYWSGSKFDNVMEDDLNGHVGCARDGSGFTWSTCEGGGANGRCKLSDGTKDILWSGARPLRGVFRPNALHNSIVEKPTLPDGIHHTDIPAFIPLKFGDVSTRVGAVQLRLRGLGYELPITFRKGYADKGFGNETRLALEAFQQSKGLPVNGKIVDEATWNVLFGAV